MNLEALRDHRFPVTRVAYSDKDTMLYALSVGAASSPCDPRELRLVFEKDLRALPTIIDAVERGETVIEFVGR